MSKQPTILSAGRPSARTDKSRAATLASLASDGEMKRVNFDLSTELHTKLKIHATKQGKSIKDLLTEYVVDLPE